MTAARERGRGRTGWELRELVRPLPVRKRRSATAMPPQAIDPALVEWVYQSRFAIVSQIQRRFPEWLPSLRTAQRHVQRLLSQKVLAEAPVRSTGPHFPRVLYATGQGLTLIRDAYRRLGHDWDEPRTEDGKQQGLALDSLLHELAVTEMDLLIQRIVGSRDDLALLQRERRYFRRDRRLAYEQQGRTRHVVPDAGYLTAVESEDRRRLLPVMFLELENGTHSMRRIQRKLARYQQWAEQGAEEWLEKIYGRYGEPGKRSFRLLLVAHDKHGTVSDDRRLLDLFIHTLELPRRLRNAVWLTTAEELHSRQQQAAGADAPVWYRAKDASPFLAEYRSLPPGRGQQQYSRQRRLLAERLPELPRHGLFPRRVRGSADNGTAP